MKAELRDARSVNLKPLVRRPFSTGNPEWDSILKEDFERVDALGDPKLDPIYYWNYGRPLGERYLHTDTSGMFTFFWMKPSENLALKISAPSFIGRRSLGPQPTMTIGPSAISSGRVTVARSLCLSMLERSRRVVSG